MDISLNGKWKLYYYDAVERKINSPKDLKGVNFIEANVPGNVELDLAEAGFLPKDLFKGFNIEKAYKYETYDWWYETEFDGIKIPENHKLILNFEGVDCIAEYYLNGEKIGNSDNMLIPHSFDITDKIKDKNKLHIKIHSALLAENDMESNIYTAAGAWHTYDLSTRMRKAPHSYGWDIFPRALSAGIWKSVSVELRPDCYFKQTYFVTENIGEDSAKIRFMFDISLPHRYVNKDITLKVSGACGESKFEESQKMRFKSGNLLFEMKNPKLWWPYGYGDANVYDAKVELICDGEVLAKKETAFGIRTVELIRKDIADEVNNCFRFVINGVDVVCKGSNWVPLSPYHSMDYSRYEKALALVKDIGCNILRCWGGNVYEQPYFYDFCDRNGIMIWQDFSMGCFIYPQTDEFYAKMKKEVEVVVRSLRQHPSIIIWAGDNECDYLLYEYMDPNEANVLTRKIIPSVIVANDKLRPYLPSSPFFSKEIFKTKRMDLLPEDHLWGVRDFYKSEFYKNAKASFVSETGYHGCVSPESAKKFIDEEYLWPAKDNDQWNLHSTDIDRKPQRVDLMINQVKQLFGEVPDNLEDFSFASQVSQAEAKKYFIERVRIMEPKTGGIIWWNLLDGWPQFSDAVVDYYFEKKIAYDYIKRSQAPFTIICGENFNLEIPVYGVNDTLEEKKGQFSVICADTDEVLYEGEYRVSKCSKKLLCKIPNYISEKKCIIIKWDNGVNHYITGNVPYSLEKYREWFKKIR